MHEPGLGLLGDHGHLLSLLGQPKSPQTLPGIPWWGGKGEPPLGNHWTEPKLNAGAHSVAENLLPVSSEGRALAL